MKMIRTISYEGPEQAVKDFLTLLPAVGSVSFKMLNTVKITVLTNEEVKEDEDG